jgi:hypothetical protein
LFLSTHGCPKPVYFDEKSQAGLMSLNRGNVVSATYTESAATELEKLAE